MEKGICPKCEVQIGSSSGGYDLAYHKGIANLSKVETFKKGSLHICDACENHFYFGLDSFAHSISKKDLDGIRNWSQRDLRIPAEYIDLISKLGPLVEIDGTITVPCSCEFKDGFIAPKVLLQITNYPPKIKRAYIRYWDEVAQVSSSPFALPRFIRIATRIEPERGMGATTEVSITSNSETIRLQNVCDFSPREVNLDNIGIIPQDKTPSPSSVRRYLETMLKKPVGCYLFGFDITNATTVYADMEDTSYKNLILNSIPMDN